MARHLAEIRALAKLQIYDRLFALWHIVHLPVFVLLVLSVIDMADSRSLCRRLGADGYLTKPYDPADLLEQIELIAQDVWERSHGLQSRQERRIRFNCRCGKRFKVSPSHRGKTLTCPDCGEPLIVPHHD